MVKDLSIASNKALGKSINDQILSVSDRLLKSREHKISTNNRFSNLYFRRLQLEILETANVLSFSFFHVF